MSTSQNKFDSIEKIIFDEGLRILSIEVKPELDTMFVYLNNDRVFKVRISLYARLAAAGADDLNQFRLIANGTGIHWPELDEDLSLKGFLREFLRQEVMREKELVIA